MKRYSLNRDFLIMDDKEKQKFREHYSALPDGELLDLLKDGEVGLVEGAYELVKDEAIKRKLVNSEGPPIKKEQKLPYSLDPKLYREKLEGMSFPDKYIFSERKYSPNIIIHCVRINGRNNFVVNLATSIGFGILFLYFSFTNNYYKWPMCFIAVYLFVNSLLSLHTLFFPLSDTAYMYLSRFGDPQKVAESIENELRKWRLRISSAFFTRSWFLNLSWNGTNILMLGEIVWFYTQSKKVFTNFVHTRTENNIIIHHRNTNQPITIGCNEAEAKALLHHLSQRLPWAAVGYSDEYINLWHMNPPEFIEKIKDKQAEFIEQYKREMPFNR
jgi:hypothetical protein